MAEEGTTAAFKRTTEGLPLLSLCYLKNVLIEDEDMD